MACPLLGYRTLTTRSWTACGGAGVSNDTIQMVRKPAGSPKIADAIEQMRARLAGALGVDPARVSVKGKTNEGVDAVGRGDAIAAHAVALVSRGSGRSPG